MNEQLKIRITSSLYSLGVLVLIAGSGFLLSPDFTKWVTDTFKESPFLLSFIAYMLPEIAKAIRNYAVSKKQTLGSKENKTFLI